MAPTVAGRLADRHPPTRPRAGRPEQPRANRPGAEPARLPGRRRRPPHPLRRRGAPAGPAGDGRVRLPHRTALLTDPDLRRRGRRLRLRRARLGLRRCARRAALSAQPGPQGRPGRGQAAPALPRGRAGRRPGRQAGGHRAGTLRPDGAHPTGHHRAVQGGGQRLVPGALHRHRPAAPDPGADQRDLRARRPRPSATRPDRRRAEHGRREHLAAGLPGLDLLRRRRHRQLRRTAGQAGRRLPRDHADGAADRREPEPAARAGDAHPFPLGGRLRHDRHRQADDRHLGRGAGHVLQVGPQVRLREVGGADELLHHAQPRTGAGHQRRTRRRRGRALTRPPRLRPQQPAEGPGERRHADPAVEPDPRADLALAARQGTRDDPRATHQVLRAGRLRGRRRARPDPRTADPHDGHRLHRCGRRRCRPGRAELVVVR